MTARGLYKGEIDGVIADELERAVRAYKGAMGLKDDLSLDVEFFRTYLLSHHAETQPRAQARLKAINEAEGPIVAAAPAAAQAEAQRVAQAPAQAAPAPQPGGKTPAAAAAGTTAPAASARSALTVQGTKDPQYVYRRGESLDVEVAVAGNGFPYCFLIDDSKMVSQFFPNPAQPAAAVSAGSRLLFPGRFPFQFLASAKGATETVACFNSGKDLGPSIPLPPTLRDLSGLQQAMAQRAGASTELGVFDVKVR